MPDVNPDARHLPAGTSPDRAVAHRRRGLGASYRGSARGPSWLALGDMVRRKQRKVYMEKIAVRTRVGRAGVSLPGGRNQDLPTSFAHVKVNDADVLWNGDLRMMLKTTRRVYMQLWINTGYENILLIL